MLRADLHVHTCYSIDCFTPLERIVERCLDLGIGCVAIADHNTIEGALKLSEMAPFRVIVAEEVQTPAGEIMGLFLKERVPPGMSPEETIACIRGQGGLVAIPHPFGRSFLGNANKLTSPDIMSRVDIVEAFNSRTAFTRSIARAQRLAIEHGKAASAGSDAHTASEIGRAYVEMDEFDSPELFLASLARGKVFGRKSGYTAHFASTWARIRKQFLGSRSRSQT